MWGAEMGCNEHGVCIGNEALFSRQPPSKTPGLTGMDIVRLALERASSAEMAVNLIGNLLETYGQGGRHAAPGCNPAFYHNAFLVVDSSSTAWHVESVGRAWIARRVTSGPHTNRDRNGDLIEVREMDN